jgi:hypothetical protein
MTAAFERGLRSVPDDIREIAMDAIRNPDSYQLKKLHQSGKLRRNSWSVRLANQGYRAVAARSGSTWVWYFIGDHGEYDRLMR